MLLETRSLPLEVTALHKAEDDETQAEFEGFASTFGNTDLVGDVIEPGAFRGSLGRRPANRVRMLWQHNPDEPIGVWKEMEETDKGLRAKGRLLLDVTRGRDAYGLLKGKAIDSLSIGFRMEPKDAEWDEQARVRRIKRVDLMEVSLVTFPANPKARISRVKDEDGTYGSVREMERALLGLGFSRSDATEIINKGYRALLATRDAGDEPGQGTRDAALEELLGSQAQRWADFRKALSGRAGS